MRALMRRLGAFGAALLLFLQPAFAARIVAVGDLHGDYEAFLAVATEAGLIDARGKWAGGTTVFVQLGDIPDRGPDSRRIMTHLIKLEKQARKKGGRVIALIGNHEAMNMTGDLRYVAPGEYDAFRTKKSKSLRDRYFRAHATEIAARYPGEAQDAAALKAAFERDVPLGYLEHRQAFAPNGSLGKWIGAHDAIAVVEDSLFVHGGVSDAYSGRSPAAINDEVRAALNGKGPEAILTDEFGPLWYRGAAADTAESAAEAQRTTTAQNVARIIIGHTPSLTGIKSLHGGRVIVIDTGMSAAYGGVRSWLEINEGALVAHENGAARGLGGAGGNP